MSESLEKIAKELLYKTLKSVDSLHGEESDEPQRGLIGEGLITYCGSYGLHMWAHENYCLTQKGSELLERLKSEFESKT